VSSARRRLLGRRAQAASSVALPLFAFIAVVGIWQLAVALFDVDEYLVPSPVAVIVRFSDEVGPLWEQSLVTGKEILAGFALATLVSVPAAFVFATVRPFEKAFYPLVFFQIIPKIAVAPLLIVWFGLGTPPKVLFTFLLCFFPILVDGITGFKSIDKRLLYITSSMGATRWQTFRYVRFRAALPFILSGMKIAMAFAVTGAIVAEFVGSNAGLGYVLLRAGNNVDTPMLFAVLVALSLMGLVLNYALSVAEYVLMPWRRDRS
jgi:NitT/TauT family transport system permease protein